MTKAPPASDERSVRSLYQDEGVARTYLEERFTHAWGRLLHERQVETLNGIIEARRIRSALELAPGPARLAVALRGIESGVMVEGSEAMIAIARERLRDADLLGTWDVRHGNAFDLGSLGRTFDLVFAFRFIRHLLPDDRKRLYEAVRDRLPTDGVFVFDVVNRPVRERIDARRGSTPAPGLAVYDALYAPDEIRAEMEAAGFSVLALHPVIRHFRLQAAISHRVGPRLPRAAFLLVHGLERVPSDSPLEWICVASKTGSERPRAS